jgi:uncharacterized protein (DUF433 family)
MTLDLYRTGKSYTIREVAALTATSPQTIRSWLPGDDREHRRIKPVFGQPRESKELSFLELAELVVAAKFRAYGGKLQKIRDAHRYAGEHWPDLPYPFASLRLKILGGEVIHQFDLEYGGQALAISIRDQFAIPSLVEDALDLFEFDEEDQMATRWFPAGRDVPIVLDPRFAGGRLAVASRGVTVETIGRRFHKGKQSIDFIARDLQLKRHEVEEALRLSEAA